MAACAYPLYLPKTEMYVPCGKCGYCLVNRRKEWVFRIANEMKYAETACFITLTYTDEYVPIQNGTGKEILDKKDLQDFFKRLRYYHGLHHTTQIRYYAVGEYGTQFKRPHYHAILFNAYPKDVETAWPLGFVHFEPVKMARVGYVVGYVSSLDNDSVGRGVPKQFCIMSKRPALGHNYIRTHSKWHIDGLRNYTKVEGKLARLPRYYKKKMFTENQKEVLTRKAIDSYEDQYYNLFYHYKKLGYPDPAATVSETISFNEKQIMKTIVESKLKL